MMRRYRRWLGAVGMAVILASLFAWLAAGYPLTATGLVLVGVALIVVAIYAG
jgi:hypothetical protein